jgi:tRNA threonylcarbamoyladenosine modification (KEOPS) complex  Pcc1 subunit
MINVGKVVASVQINVREGISSLIDESLSPDPTSERSKVTVSSEKGRVIIFIEASDVVALRAALNSYLRWVGAILDVVDAVG